MKKIVVLGGGESGVGSAILAQKMGFDVFLSDRSMLKNKYRGVLQSYRIPFEEGEHTEKKILDADEVIKSPGIPDTVPMILALKEKGIPVISEIEFGGRYTKARSICITGSNGKTTTTMLLYTLLQEAGYKVGLAGIVGKSFAWQVAEKHFDWFVIELSSFQLDGMYSFHPYVSILLNVTPDHLDRYDYKFENYLHSKMRIDQNLDGGNTFIYWQEDKNIQAALQESEPLKVPCLCFSDEHPAKGATIEDGLLKFNHYINLQAFEDSKVVGTKQFNAKEKKEAQTPVNQAPCVACNCVIPIDKLALKGRHNLYNAMAAGLAALSIGVNPEAVMSTLTSFKGVEHRLETVRTLNGVTYINDSKATNVSSCWYALQAMTKPTILILGGTDKGNDYNEIKNLLEAKVTALVFLGVDNKKLIEYSSKHIPQIPFREARSMSEAVELCSSFAKEGQTVLLSPCCASFDLFKNYEDRGNQFKQVVNSL